MTTAITTTQQQMPVSTMADLATAGQLIAQSGILGARNPADGFIIATTCYQAGVSLLEFGETYHIIQGRISMRSDAMLAKFHELGGKHRIIERSPERAAVELEYNGNKTTFELSWQDALQEPFVYASPSELSKPEKERKLKHNYSSPRMRMQMLWARVVSDAVRAICPQVNRGSYTPEEVEDFTESGNGYHSEPKPIDPKEAQSRVKTIIPEVDTTDYNVCPLGTPGDGYNGKPWREFDTETLKKALDAEGMELMHYEAIIQELKTRKETEK